MRFPFANWGGGRSFGINHILSTGQSLSTGVQGRPALSTSQPFANLMFTDGVNPSTLTSLVPLVESDNVGANTGETMSSCLANHITSKAPAHVSLVSVHGAASTPYSGIKKGTGPYTRGMNQATAGTSLAASAGKSYAVRCVTVVHGESDAANGNLTYDNDMIQFQSDYETDVKAITGQSGSIPLLHTQVSTIFGSNDVPLAQLRAHVRAPGKVILVGPKYQLPYVDGTHCTNEGYRQLGELYAKVYERVILQGGTWEPLRPISLTRLGAVITVTFTVPALPLVFDSALVTLAANKGFEYLDTSGATPAISTVAISGSTVIITLASTPVGSGRVRYAQISAAPYGNLRDSDATPSQHGYALYNWCCHFDEVCP